MGKIKLILFILFILINYNKIFIHGKTIYVTQDNTGDYSTISSALDVLSQGDTVIIKKGIYNESINLPVGGTKNDYLAIIGEDNVIIDGSNLNEEHIIHIENKSYVVIKNLEIRNTPNAETPVGIFVTGGGENILIENCKVHNINITQTDAHGIAVYGNSANPIKNIIIRGCEVYNNKLGSSEAVVLNGNVDGFVVENNVVHDNDNIGIDFIGFEGVGPTEDIDQARNGVCRGNIVYNISSKDNLAYNGDMSADGIYVDGGKNIIIERNKVYACDYGIEVASEHLDKVTYSVDVRNNLIYNCNNSGIAFGGYDTDRGWAKYCRFYNNTLYNNGIGPQGYSQILMQKSKNNQFFNNIIYGTSGKVMIEDPLGYYQYNDFNYNLWYSPDGDNTEWDINGGAVGFDEYRQKTGYGANSIFADPSFVDKDNFDFHLLSTSPAIDIGSMNDLNSNTIYPDNSILDLDGNNRIVGEGVDLGCFEYGSTTYIKNNIVEKDTYIEVYPNPFNPTTTIRIITNRLGIVLAIYDINGKIIKRKEFNRIGVIKYNLSLENKSSGVYFVKVIDGKNIYIRKLIFVK